MLAANTGLLLDLALTFPEVDKKVIWAPQILIKLFEGTVGRKSCVNFYRFLFWIYEGFNSLSSQLQLVCTCFFRHLHTSYFVCVLFSSPWQQLPPFSKSFIVVSMTRNTLFLTVKTIPFFLNSYIAILYFITCL